MISSASEVWFCFVFSYPVTFSLVVLLNLSDSSIEKLIRDFPGGTVVKNPPANAGDMDSIPGLGRTHMPQSN